MIKVNLKSCAYLIFWLACCGIAAICPALELPTKVDLSTAPEIKRDAAHLEVQIVFNISPGWHIYYKEPGDSGFPTKINFKLSEQIELHDLIWPNAEEFVLPGEKRCKGYSNTATLRAKLVAKRELVPGEILPIEADVSWLNCKEEMCVPQRQHFEHTVKVL